jgi:hypothetical protein
LAPLHAVGPRWLTHNHTFDIFGGGKSKFLSFERSAILASLFLLSNCDSLISLTALFIIMIIRIFTMARDWGVTIIGTENTDNVAHRPIILSYLKNLIYGRLYGLIFAVCPYIFIIPRGVHKSLAYGYLYP